MRERCSRSASSAPRRVPIQRTIQAARVNSGNIKLRADNPLSRRQSHSGASTARPSFLRHGRETGTAAKDRGPSAMLADGRATSTGLVAEIVPPRNKTPRPNRAISSGRKMLARFTEVDCLFFRDSVELSSRWRNSRRHNEKALPRFRTRAFFEKKSGR